MEYLSAIIVSLVFPFIYNGNENVIVDHNFGVRFTPQQFNSLSSSPIKDPVPQSSSKIVDTKFSYPTTKIGFVYYQRAYLNDTTDYWIETGVEWFPTKTAIEVVLKPELLQFNSTVAYSLMELPGITIKLGKDITNDFSLYGGIKLQNVAYEALSVIEVSQIKESTMQFKLGAYYKLSSSWNSMIEGSYYKMDLRGISGQRQDLTLGYTQILLGVNYTVNAQKNVSNIESSENTYSDILRSFDNTVGERKEQKEKLEKEANKKELMIEDPVIYETENLGLDEEIQEESVTEEVVSTSTTDTTAVSPPVVEQPIVEQVDPNDIFAGL